MITTALAVALGTAFVCAVDLARRNSSLTHRNADLAAAVEHLEGNAARHLQAFELVEDMIEDGSVPAEFKAKWDDLWSTAIADYLERTGGFVVDDRVAH